MCKWCQNNEGETLILESQTKIGPREMAQHLRVLAILPKDQSSILSTHTKGFTLASNSISRGSHTLYQRHPKPHALTHRHTHM